MTIIEKAQSYCYTCHHLEVLILNHVMAEVVMKKVISIREAIRVYLRSKG